MSTIRIPPILKQFSRTFIDAGYECYLVGGAVRSMLLNRDRGDFDVATNAPPERVRRLFRRVIPTGIRHGTVTVLFKGEQIEVTTYRTEGRYSDSRHPDSVEFVGSIDEDLKRRDFTINSIAAELPTGRIYDPNDGRGDLKRSLIRTIGDPEERFSEDGLRLMRACRFAAQLEFKVEETTLTAISTCAVRIDQVSAERKRDELMRMLESRRPSIGLNLMAETSLLKRVIPEMDRCRGVDQKGMHKFDVFTHSLLACDAAPPDNPTVRLAALFHDIGKPDAKQTLENGEVVFYGHEEISEKIAESIMRRLRFPRNAEREVGTLIRNHMFNYTTEWSDSAIRRFLRRVGRENVDKLFALRRADSTAIEGTPASGKGLEELNRHIHEVLSEENALSYRDLDVDGNELAEEADIPKGPEMGVVFEFLLDAVLDDPALNERSRLLEMARRYYETRVRRGG